MADLTVFELAAALQLLDPLPPITVALDKWGSRYSSQREHVVQWLRSQTVGTGASVRAFSYQRQAGNESAKVAYSRLLNPGALLWLAEVLGESADRLTLAVEAATEAEKKNYRSRCAAFRRVIPFDRVVELYACPTGWKIDEELLPVLAFDVDGRPSLQPGASSYFRKLARRKTARQTHVR